jgi:hypothetical protein
VPQLAASPAPSEAAATATPQPAQSIAEASPIRIEKATPVSPVAHASPAAPAAGGSAMASTKTVTITEPVLGIPVKQDGKITGYINLVKGQQITPVSVENDQIKVKSGENSFVYVPVKSTDMTH